MKFLSCVQLFVTPWTVAYQALLSMGFPRPRDFPVQGYWNELPFPSPGGLPNPGSNPGLPHCKQMLCHLRHRYSKENLKRDEQARINIKHSNCAKHYIAINSNVTITPFRNSGIYKIKVKVLVALL